MRKLVDKALMPISRNPSNECRYVEPQFNVSRVRKIKGEADYDKLRRF